MSRAYHFLGAGLVSVALLLATLRAAAGDAESSADSMFDGLTYRSLVAEHKALRVGDVLTVVVHEAASATSTADLRRQRKFAVSAQLDSTKGGAYSAAAGTDTESEGAGRTARSGRLLAQLSVRVTEVNQNGDLLVAGQQSLRINGEEQLITLSGLVRTRDIGENNTVLSSRIAQARIRFDGKGFVTDQSRPGWLAWLFRWLGL